MISSRLIFTSLWVALTCCTATAQSLAPREGAVLLRNGRVLNGVISTEGDRYVVTLPGRATVRLSAREVDMVGRDLEEIHDRRLRRIDPQNVAQQLELAQWCYRQALYREAASRLIAVYRLDPKNRDAAALERRLRARVATPQGGPAKAVEPPSTKQSDQQAAVAHLSSAVVSSFTTTIQPILMNRCAAAGCHGATSTGDFRLVRSPPRTSMPRRFTQRNLYEVILQIDKENPEQSPLLLKAAAAHGGRRDPVFAPSEGRYLAQLALWAKYVARHAEDDPPRSVHPPQQVLTQSSSATPAGVNLPSDTPKNATDPQRTQPAAPAPGLDTPETTATPARRPGEEQSDPFDPQAFNRRWHPDGPPAVDRSPTREPPVSSFSRVRSGATVAHDPRDRTAEDLPPAKRPLHTAGRPSDLRRPDVRTASRRPTARRPLEREGSKDFDGLPRLGVVGDK